MEWRKKLPLILSPLLLLSLFLVNEKKKEPVLHHKERKIASNPHKRMKSVTRAEKMRSIAAIESKIIKHSVLRNRIPQSLEETFEKDPGVKLTRGYEYLKDVAAVPKDKYDPSMGSVIQQTNQFVYFRTTPGHNYVPVAISKNTNMLYPISSILHVKGATPDIRSRLLGEGYTQYYYHAPLKLLSVESKGGVMNTYSQLKNEGYKVELEVLKPHHQTL